MIPLGQTLLEKKVSRRRRFCLSAIKQENARQYLVDQQPATPYIHAKAAQIVAKPPTPIPIVTLPAPNPTVAPPASAKHKYPPTWPVPVIQNVVATVNFNALLNLDLLASQARNVEYSRKKFHAAIMRIRSPKSTALLFKSGRVVVTGAKSEADARLAARKHARAVQKCGHHGLTFSDFCVQNFVASVSAGFVVHLEGLRARHHLYTSYEPEIFPGLVFRLVQPRLVCLIFANGKIVLTGGKSEEAVYEAFAKIFPICLDHAKW